MTAAKNAAVICSLLGILVIVACVVFVVFRQRAERAFRQELLKSHPAEDILTVNGRCGLMTFEDNQVLDVQTWSETRVSGSSSGGGGYLYQGTGSVSAPSVSINSQTSTTTRVFLESEAGRHWHFDTRPHFAVKVGDIVRSYGVRTRSGSRLAVVVNRKTGARWSWDVREFWPKYTVLAPLIGLLLVIEALWIYALSATPVPSRYDSWQLEILVVIAVAWAVTGGLLGGGGWLLGRGHTWLAKSRFHRRMSAFVARTTGETASALR